MIYKLHIDAFAATPETARVFGQLREDRDLAKSRIAVHDGGLAAAARFYAENPTPQVILVEEVGDDREMMEHLGMLAEVCEPGTKVIVVGQLNDIGVYRTLMAQGVSEYLYAPVTVRQITDTLGAIFADPSAAPRGRLLAVFGARGGVGASTLAQNVAWETAQALGEDIIYIDFDVSFGTSPLAFNAEAKNDLGDALAQPERIDAVLLERFLVRYGDHLQILMGAGDLRAQPSYDPEAVDKVMEVARQMAPVVVADVPHIWAPWTEQLLRTADDLVVVAQPDLANLRDCKNLVEQVIGRRGDLPTRLVLNRVDAYKKTQLSAKDFQETLGFAPALSIPFDPNLFGTASNHGQMLGETARTHKTVEALRHLAGQMTGRGGGDRKGKGKGKGLAMGGWLAALAPKRK